MATPYDQYGEEMTYAQAREIAAQYGHVPVRVSGPPIDGTGGGPNSQAGVDAIRGVWVMPNENGPIPITSNLTPTQTWRRDLSGSGSTADVVRGQYGDQAAPSPQQRPAPPSVAPPAQLPTGAPNPWAGPVFQAAPGGAPSPGSSPAIAAPRGTAPSAMSNPDYPYSPRYRQPYMGADFARPGGPGLTFDPNAQPWASSPELNVPMSMLGAGPQPPVGPRMAPPPVPAPGPMPMRWGEMPGTVPGPTTRPTAAGGSLPSTARPVSIINADGTGTAYVGGQWVNTPQGSVMPMTIPDYSGPKASTETPPLGSTAPGSPTVEAPGNQRPTGRQTNRNNANTPVGAVGQGQTMGNVTITGTAPDGTMTSVMVGGVPYVWDNISMVWRVQGSAPGSPLMR